jgi:peptidoglycan/LPS O-acetylase OafA/YrhL
VLAGLPAYLLLVAALACVSYRFVEFPQRSWRQIFLPARSTC